MKQASTPKRTPPAATAQRTAFQEVLARVIERGGGLEGLSERDLVILDAEIDRETLKTRVARAIAAARFSAEDELFAWLSTFPSEATRSNYEPKVRRFLAWCAAHRRSPLFVTSARADSYIATLAGAPATVRKHAQAVSSWYSWLRDRGQIERNPFRRSRAMPADRPVRELRIPTRTEVERLIASLEPLEAAAVAVLAYAGVRVGSLSSFSCTGNEYRAVSKGKRIAGTLPREALVLIGRLPKLERTEPFAGLTGRAWERRIARLIAACADNGYISSFPPHSLRHYAAIRMYRATKSVDAVCALLGHTDLRTTERYLRSIKNCISSDMK